MKYTRKYHNKKTEVNGITFDSKKEAERYCELVLEERTKQIFDLKMQVPFEVVPSQKTSQGTLRPCKYVADFVYFDKAGKMIVEDVKGYRTPEYQIKKKLMFEKFGIEISEK